jgi:2,4-dienoyl-CoA reductase-like NADH-dependent reductase (Old Yellow Enzyme family)
MNAFAQARLGRMTLENRFVRSATAEGMATAGGHGSRMLTTCMTDLAQGGVGLIITGHTAVSPEGRAGSRQLCLWHADQLAALSEVTQSVHDAGGKIVLQISHAGLFSNPAVTQEASIGPMIKKKEDGSCCREMARLDIRRVTEAFARAAHLARRAGFDGVQIHAAHGYLLSSFLSPHYNQRLDEYGGTVENRARFLLEVSRAVLREAGSDFPVLVKMNVNDFLPGGAGVDDMVKTAILLEGTGITALELSGGTLASGTLVPARPGKIKREEEGYYRDDAQYFKEKSRLPLILGGGFRTLAAIQNALNENVCDFIAMARPFIREPGLIKRWKRGDMRPSLCVSDNLCFQPVRAGKGLYCLTAVKEKKKVRGQAMSSASPEENCPDAG